MTNETKEEPICRLKNVWLKTGDKLRLIDINFEVYRGELVLIEGAGQTSPGKTSLLNVLTGYEGVTKGDVTVRGSPVLHTQHSEKIVAFYPFLNTARIWQSLRFYHGYDDRPFWAYFLPDFRKREIISQKLITIIQKTVRLYFPGLQFYELTKTSRPKFRPYLPKTKKWLKEAGLKPKPVPEDAKILPFKEGAVHYLRQDWRLPDDFLLHRFLDLSGGMKRQFINSVAFLASAIEDSIFIGDCPDLYLDAFKSDIFIAWIEKMLKERHALIFVLTAPYMKEQIRLLDVPIREYFIAEGRLEQI